MDRDRTKVNANEDEQRSNRTKEHPSRPVPDDPDRMEGPGGQKAEKAEEDARNKSTRRGER